MKRKGIEKNVELIEGDITKTIPQYVDNNPHFKISLLNLDTDIYEPAVAILEHLWPRIVRGGVLILEDYDAFSGEIKAVDDCFDGKDIIINKFDFSRSPCYIMKD